MRDGRADFPNRALVYSSPRDWFTFSFCMLVFPKWVPACCASPCCDYRQMDSVWGLLSTSVIRRLEIRAMAALWAHMECFCCFNIYCLLIKTKSVSSALVMSSETLPELHTLSKWGEGTLEAFLELLLTYRTVPHILLCIFIVLCSGKNLDTLRWPWLGSTKQSFQFGWILPPLSLRTAFVCYKFAWPQLSNCA